jgi:hypothetical protein
MEVTRTREYLEVTESSVSNRSTPAATRCGKPYTAAPQSPRAAVVSVLLRVTTCTRGRTLSSIRAAAMAGYLANYADLRAVFGTNTQPATLHSITDFEGRTG